MAKIAADADSDKRTVTFSTSSGTLIGAAGAGMPVDVVAGSDGRATVILQSSQRVETAIVTASVKSMGTVVVSA